MFQIRHLDPVTFVRDHEDAPVGTILRAQAAPDAVIFNHDLEMFAAMNRIDRAAHHAMRIGAGPAGGGNEKIIQPSPGPEQARDGNAMSLGAVPFDTASGAGIAPGAVIQVEHEHALAFVKTLRDIFVHHPMTHPRVIQTSHRLLDEPAAQHIELAQHKQKISPAQLR